MNGKCRAARNVGLYVWVSNEGAVSIDLRLHDLSSLTLSESVQYTKVLMRLYVKGKAYLFDKFVRGTAVHAELTKALNTLGIARTLLYHGTNTSEFYVPVGIAVKWILCKQQRATKADEAAACGLRLLVCNLAGRSPGGYFFAPSETSRDDMIDLRWRDPSRRAPWCKDARRSGALHWAIALTCHAMNLSLFVSAQNGSLFAINLGASTRKIDRVILSCSQLRQPGFAS